MQCQKARIVESENWDCLHPDSHGWVRQNVGRELWVKIGPPHGSIADLNGGEVRNSVKTPYLLLRCMPYLMSLDVLELLPETGDIPEQPLPDWLSALRS